MTRASTPDARAQVAASVGAMIRAWRHPRPQNVEGIVIGHTDAPVDPRRVRRLARRIARIAQRENLPREIWTSPLRRCADVGRWLKRRGWVHHIDARLIEMNFGAWERQRWRDIPRDQIDAWAARFAHYAAGGGESVEQLIARAASWPALPEQSCGAPAPRPEEAGANTTSGGRTGAPACTLLVAHSGWMRARRWAAAAPATVPDLALPLSSATFPPSPAYGECWIIGAVRSEPDQPVTHACAAVAGSDQR